MKSKSPQGEQSVERMVAGLGVYCTLSDRDRFAIEFALRMAYGLGYLDGYAKVGAA